MKYLVLSSILSLALATTPSVPLPSASCTPGTSYCAGEMTNIILRCDNGKIQPGNCNDNTGEPVQGALCQPLSPSSAYCSIIGSGPISTGISGTGTGMPPAPTNNSTLSVTATPTASQTSGGGGPVQTGAAAAQGVAFFGAVAAAVLGAAVAL